MSRTLSIAWWFGVMLLLVPPAAGAGTQTVFYVAPTGQDRHPGTLEQPFQTIDKARQAVQAIKGTMSGDILVYLRGGMYPLASTLTFSAADSGTNGHHVIYQAYPGEQPIISGGLPISGWTPVGNGMYKANVGARRFRQLYVNGTPAIRARTPNVGSYFRVGQWHYRRVDPKDWSCQGADKTLSVKSAEVGPWANLQEGDNPVEMVIHRQWTQANLRIASLHTTSGQTHITPMEPERCWAFHFEPTATSTFYGNESYYFENALELLDVPGEWYLRTTTGDVFYMPRAGEPMASAVVIAPGLERLLQIQGSPHAPATHLHFVGLAFQHATWLPAYQGRPAGFVNRVGDIWPPPCDFTRPHLCRAIPAAIHVQDAESIRFDAATFANLGAAGVAFFSGVHSSAIVGSLFQDIAASAIQVAPALPTMPAPPVDWSASHHISITNNLITRAALDYRSSVGIFMNYTMQTSIEHNEITDLPYNGIYFGCCNDSRSSTAFGHNSVRYNRIHNVMTLMADGAGIYTPGPGVGTVIGENYVYDIRRSAFAGGNPVVGLYYDQFAIEGTAYNNVYENVGSPLGHPPYNAHLFLNADANNHTIINHMGSVTNRGTNNTFTTAPGFDPEAVKANAGMKSTSTQK